MNLDDIGIEQIKHDTVFYITFMCIIYHFRSTIFFFSMRLAHHALPQGFNRVLTVHYWTEMWF